MADVNFCCRSGGSNMNAGTLDGGTTEVSASASVTYTGGDWDSTTDIYTAPSGADMTEAQVGRYASVYVDGDTTPTNNRYLIGKITAVDSGTRQITLSTSLRWNYGIEVTTGTGTRSARIGGAWSGVVGTTLMPWISSATPNALASSTDVFVVNYKNDQTYSFTSLINIPNSSGILRGYSSTYSDGGRAAITTSNAMLISYSSGTYIWDSLDLTSTVGSGSNTMIAMSAGYNTMRNCAIHGCRGAGMTCGSNCLIEACEFYGNNTTGGANLPGLSPGSGSMMRRCVFHDNSAGSSTDGCRVAASQCTFEECIFDSNQRYGLCLAGNYFGTNVNRCEFYGNGNSGFVSGVTTTTYANWLKDCNFFSNGGYGIEMTTNTTMEYALNCAFGSGTKANSSGTVLNLRNNVNPVTFTANETPWTDPANGDFRINHADAKNAGCGNFTQTSGGGYGGTVAYNDRGAARHIDPVGGGARLVGSSSLITPGR